MNVYYPKIGSVSITRKDLSNIKSYFLEKLFSIIANVIFDRYIQGEKKENTSNHFRTATVVEKKQSSRQKRVTVRESKRFWRIKKRNKVFRKSIITTAEYPSPINARKTFSEEVYGIVYLHVEVLGILIKVDCVNSKSVLIKHEQTKEP